MCVLDMPGEDFVEVSNNASPIVWQQLQCFYNDQTESHHTSKLYHTSCLKHQPVETPTCEPKTIQELVVGI